MTWYLRAIELNSGGWACRFGLSEYDTHAQLDQAIDHLTVLAGEYSPVELFVHYRDGSVQRRGPVKPM